MLHNAIEHLIAPTTHFIEVDGNESECSFAILSWKKPTTVERKDLLSLIANHGPQKFHFSMLHDGYIRSRFRRPLDRCASMQITCIYIGNMHMSRDTIRLSLIEVDLKSFTESTTHGHKLDERRSLIPMNDSRSSWTMVGRMVFDSNIQSTVSRSFNHNHQLIKYRNFCGK